MAIIYTQVRTITLVARPLLIFGFSFAEINNAEAICIYANWVQGLCRTVFWSLAIRTRKMRNS